MPLTKWELFEYDDDDDQTNISAMLKFQTESNVHQIIHVYAACMAPYKKPKLIKN